MSPDKQAQEQQEEQQECVGTCFSCIPQCERRKPEDTTVERETSITDGTRNQQS